MSFPLSRRISEFEPGKKDFCVSVVQILGISRLRLSPKAFPLLSAALPCLRQAPLFLSPTSIVSTVFAEVSRKMRSQWVSGGQGLTRCQGSSWKSHQAGEKKLEKQERRNGRGKIRLAREIRIFFPRLQAITTLRAFISEKSNFFIESKCLIDLYDFAQLRFLGYEMGWWLANRRYLKFASEAFELLPQQEINLSFHHAASTPCGNCESAKRCFRWIWTILGLFHAMAVQNFPLAYFFEQKCNATAKK